jgi:PAS domain S-box-containing protein
VPELRDITERRHAEEALRASEERLRFTAERAEVGYWYWDIAADLLEWSPLCMQLFGLAPEEPMSYARFLAALHPDDRERTDRVVRAYLERPRQRALEIEYRTKWPNGVVRWIHAKGDAVFKDGVPTRMAGLMLDITERKLVEKELIDAREQLAVFVEHAPAAIVMWDTEMRYLAVSRRFAQDYGFQPEDLIGRMHYDAFPEIPQRWREIHQRCLAGAVERAEEDAFVRADGSIEWVRWEIRPWRKRDGAIGGLLLFNEVITERLRAERALKTSEERLRVADRGKDEFIAMLAHELRNPLAPLCNAAAILKQTVGNDERAKKPLAILTRQTEQLSRLVDDLLDMSRIAAGRITLALKPVEMGEILAQAVEGVQPLLHEKSHQLVIAKFREPVYVNGDATRLIQSLGNVLNNAAKYTHAGGVIRLELQASDSDVEVRVVDNGDGIAPALLPHVFDLFVQAERTLDRAQGGLGIGLSVVKRLIQMHGGSVHAQSAGLGQGTTFTLRLPRIEKPIASPPLVRRLRATSRRILVVDDNADAADSLTMLLSLQGHQAEAVYSAQSALEAAERLLPEFILLDIGLPEIDGYEVARRLRASERLRRIRLIALTGYGQTRDRERATAVGFDGHLVKPATLDQLARIFALDRPPEIG